MKAGCWGRLKSCDPPITVPAWAVMMSSKDPGTLGCYGFRNRKDHSYDAMCTANATVVKEPRVWDILANHQKKSVLLGVPQTYPIKPLPGATIVSGFLAPDTSVDYTYPKTVKEEIARRFGDFILDVRDFRTDQKEKLLKQIYELMHNRFDVAEYLMESKPWDFFMMVEMGIDRIHHGMWQFADPAHPRYEPNNPYATAISDYYAAVDERIGRLLDKVGDETTVMVVSDHGAKPMVGGICVNQWLIEEGLLTVNDDLNGVKRIEDCDIDWGRTKCWSSGGYLARMFFNVEGREPNGIVPQAEYESFQAEMIARIEAMVDHEGQPLNNKVHRPEDLYACVRGIAPDLIVYFGDLYWRSVGMVGFDSIYTFENDTGPDGANHDYHGIFIMDDRTARDGESKEDLEIMDIAPTVLQLLGVQVPPDMQGKAIT